MVFSFPSLTPIADFFSTGDPQIAAGFSLILRPFRSPGKAEPARFEADPLTNG
jgi:hypothetical protein